MPGHHAAQSAKHKQLLHGTASAPSGWFQKRLNYYRDLTLESLITLLPKGSIPYLYDLIPAYPRRSGKGLRSALCLATCSALGGSIGRALNTAVAIELFHNAFLIHDDVQDGSLRRRGGPSLHSEYGVGIAVNVGNATNLIALGRLLENRGELGPEIAWRLALETETMLRQSLEGQAIELGWIRDNVLDLRDRDYYRMCLKKTSWYTCIFPCRVGALIAGHRGAEVADLARFGWYLGAAFQVQDDVLNLIGDYGKYGKEIAGDLWEGKRTLIVIDLLRHCTNIEKRQIGRFLAKPRSERSQNEVDWLHDKMVKYGSVEYARKCARRLAGAALIEGLKALRTVPDSESKRFLLKLPLYVVTRDR